MRLAPLAVSLLALAACMNRGLPVDTAPQIERGGEAGPAPASLRIVTYNVHDEPGGSIAAALRSSQALAGADLVVMQEVREHAGCSAACAAGRQLGMTSVYAPGHLEGPGTEGVALMSRWPVRDVEVIELPRFDVVFNSGRRAAVAVTLDTVAGPLRVYVVHLDNRLNPADRIRQFRPVLDAAAAHVGPVVIAGDFNTNPFVWIHHVVPVPAGVQQGRLEAAVRAAGLDTPVIHSGATHEWLTMRLDAIYTRGVKVPRFGVDQAVRMSDHLPLWAVIELPAAGVAAVSGSPSGS